MAPEYGATMGFFPIDGECSAYLRATGRDERHVALYEAYYQAQGLRASSISRCRPARK
jgi:aconitate hydratase